VDVRENTSAKTGISINAAAKRRTSTQNQGGTVTALPYIPPRVAAQQSRLRPSVFVILLHDLQTSPV
jgi:hypothetical protein